MQIVIVKDGLILLLEVENMYSLLCSLADG